MAEKNISEKTKAEKTAIILELLPGIEDYLCRVLADEELSEAAENRRQYYQERLDVLKLAFPPTLPPRNEGNDYIAQQRELARLRGTGTLPPPSESSEFEDGEEYDSVEAPVKVAPPPEIAFADQEDLYEEPVDLADRTPSAPFSVEDQYHSDTSYESYDDEEETPYANQGSYDNDLQLPRDDSPLQNCDINRKKRKKKQKDGVPACRLPNVSVFGDLYTKGQWSWSKRYCILTEGRFLAFKSENATKSAAEVTLDGYDIMYLEKDGKRSHVIRIARPGYVTHFYSAENKDKADQWMEVLTAAACGGSGGSITTSGFNSAASSSPKIDKDLPDTQIVQPDVVRKSSSLTDLSMTSEGSSGDGTIGQPQTTTQSDKKNVKTDRKGNKPLLESTNFWSFFGTLGKKKGEKVQQQKTKLPEMEEDADPDVAVSGYLTVYSDLMSTKKWVRKWCMVKQSILFVYRELGDETAEFSLPLPGCEVASANDTKHKMAVKIIEEGTEKISLDMPDTLAQGQWLNVLIHQTGCAIPKTPFTCTTTNGRQTDDIEEDIYCDVEENDDVDLLKSWNFPKEMGLTAESKDTSKPIKQAEEKPPPLPSGPPPGVPVSKVGLQKPRAASPVEALFPDDDIYENIDTLRSEVLGNEADQNGGTLYENTQLGVPHLRASSGTQESFEDGEIYDDVTETSEFYDDVDFDDTRSRNRSEITTPIEQQDRQLKAPRALATDNCHSDLTSPECEYLDMGNVKREEVSDNQSSFQLRVQAFEQSEDDEYLKTDASKQMNRAQRRTSIKRPTEAPPSVPMVPMVPKGSPRKVDSDEPKEVVKGYVGPTIEEDRDILLSTKNPILIQLRNKRMSTGTNATSNTKEPPTPPASIPISSSGTWKDSALDMVDEDIAQAKKKLALIKKKRAEFRGKKMTATDIDEKLAFDDRLRDLLREQDNAESALAKLSLRQAELQALARKAKLEQESIARRQSLSRVERQGSFSRIDKRDSISRSETGEWDIITKKNSLDEEASSPRKFSSGASSPRSNGSGSPASTRKVNSLDRATSSTATSPKSATIGGFRNGLNGRDSGRTRYTSDLTGRTTTRTSVTRTSSLSRGSESPGGSPRGLRVTQPDKEDKSPSPRGGRKQVQERLKLWENISGTTDC